MRREPTESFLGEGVLPAPLLPLKPTVKLRQRAIKSGLLIDETPADLLTEETETHQDDVTRRWTHRRGEASFYHLRLPPLENVDGGRGLLYKPEGYLRFGWIARVQPVLVKQALNFLLSRPHLRQPQDGARLLENLRNEFVARRYSAIRHETNTTQVRQAFEKLIELGLLQSVENGYFLDWRVLQTSPESVPTPQSVALPLLPNLLRSQPIKLDFAHAPNSINLLPIRFPTDPDDGKLISARLVVKLLRRDWGIYDPQSKGALCIAILWGRKPIVLAEWQQNISNSTATKTKTYDLTSYLLSLGAINALSLRLTADPAPPWLHINAHIELKLQK
ncbi:MAG: hypothetical protein OHK0052_00340 [Anaerolineales bacterium]